MLRVSVVAAPSFHWNDMKRIAAVAALFSVAVSTPVFAQCTAADKTALIAFDKAWGEATYRGDGPFLQSVYADGFMSVNVTGGVDKINSIAQAVAAANANKINPRPEAIADRYVIACTPLTATITHRNTVPPASGSTVGPTYSRSIHFLEKKSGKWLVVSTTGHALNDNQQLAYMEQDWNDAGLRHDTEWVAANYAPFSSDVSSRTGAIENQAQSIASSKNDKTVYEFLELSDMNTRIQGDVGIVTGINHVKGTDAAGKAFDRRIRFTDTFIRRDGRWQVWATQGTLLQ